MTAAITLKKLTITLSDRPPVRINAQDWPSIGEAGWFNGKVESQANEVASIRVRQHADGRTLVYGTRDRGPGGMPIEYRGVAAGYLLDDGRALPGESKRGPVESEAIVRAIRRVAGVLDLPMLADECIANLPPEEI